MTTAVAVIMVVAAIVGAFLIGVIIGKEGWG